MAALQTSFPLAINRLKGAGIIKNAAMHNLRELAVKFGPYNNIDSSRIADNLILRGPSSAEAIDKTAKFLMREAGITKLRKDAVLALELVFTLPANSTIKPGKYFEEATSWAESYFRVPILSSVVHLDQGAPHCHVLLLPLIENHMRGSDLHGGKAKLHSMQTSFHEEVRCAYGFARPNSRERSTGQNSSKLALLRHYFQSRIPQNAIDLILKTYAKNPERLLDALGLSKEITTPHQKSFVDIMTAPCEAEAQIPIGYRNAYEALDQGQNDVSPRHPYTCVGIGALPLPSTTIPQKKSIPESQANIQATAHDKLPSSACVSIEPHTELPISLTGAGVRGRPRVWSWLTLSASRNSCNLMPDTNERRTTGSVNQRCRETWRISSLRRRGSLHVKRESRLKGGCELGGRYARSGRSP